MLYNMVRLQRGRAIRAMAGLSSKGVQGQDCKNAPPGEKCRWLSFVEPSGLSLESLFARLVG